MLPARVLVVDDFAPFREIAISLVERAGFRVVGYASDGAEAVRRARELKPDLVLLDIGLPTLNGIEAAKRMRTIAPGSKILFVSQEGSPEVLAAALGAGGLGYVLKSRVRRELRLAIESALLGKVFLGSGPAGTEFLDHTPASGCRCHEVLFCADSRVAVEGLARFVGEALKRGDAALLCATESHQVSILERLRADGLHVEDAIRQGVFLLSDVFDVPQPDEVFEAIKDLRQAAFRRGKEHPRVAACGERAGILWAAGKIDDAFQVEQMCEHLANLEWVDLLCTYPLSDPVSVEDHPEAFRSVCAKHSTVRLK